MSATPKVEQFVMTGDVMLDISPFSPASQSYQSTSPADTGFPELTEHSIDADQQPSDMQGSHDLQHISAATKSTKANGQSTPSKIDSIPNERFILLRPSEREVECASDPSNGGTSKVDEPSAQRLAKRLYMLEGFKKSDVASHLTRDNQFSRKVAEEYLRLFDFTKLNLVEALRRFLAQFALAGETQERERVLTHFSSRYLECNPTILGKFYMSQDSCHTLTCAIMLLNTDLHGQNLGRRMTASDFIENLASLNDGTNFPKDLLKLCYSSIKREALVWSTDDPEYASALSDQVVSGNAVSSSQPSPHPSLSSFVSMPCDEGPEIKSGSLQKKHCFETDHRPVASGKRGWKSHHAVLKGMALYLLKSAKHPVGETSKFIQLHHSLAEVARNYRKKPFVFFLRTADWSEYMFSTCSVTELESWVNQINTIAAEFSAEPLAAGVGSQIKFHRPLFPSSYSKLDLEDQLASHEQKVEELRLSILEEEDNRPEKSWSKQAVANYKDKLAFLQFELKRYTIYGSLLKAKLDDSTSVGATSLPGRSCDFTDTESVMSVESLGSESVASGVHYSPRTTTSSSAAILSYAHLLESDGREVFV
ncbi:PH and SEC7 domain-containing protein 1-like isoform X2 [Watersipora subatra]|uniref:PH and SEC7 domain-containing protein 1-like isoform X2 n=1 Tax=Watersipora subatra TaxID=2589382 RepID=UPI00355C8CC5